MYLNPEHLSAQLGQSTYLEGNLLRKELQLSGGWGSY